MQEVVCPLCRILKLIFLSQPCIHCKNLSNSNHSVAAMHTMISMEKSDQEHLQTLPHFVIICFFLACFLFEQAPPRVAQAHKTSIFFLGYLTNSWAAPLHSQAHSTMGNQRLLCPYFYRDLAPSQHPGSNCCT